MALRFFYIKEREKKRKKELRVAFVETRKNDINYITAKSDAVASTVAQSRCTGKWRGRLS